MQQIGTAEGRLEVLQSSGRRGFRRFVALALVVAGCIPGLVLFIARPPGPTETFLIAMTLVLLPAGLLLLWTIRDREGQAAREVVMWLRAASRASDDEASPADEALAHIAGSEIPASTLEQLAADIRDALSPLVASPGSLSVRIAIYRFWYPIAWIVASVVLVIVFLVATSFTPPS